MRKFNKRFQKEVFKFSKIPQKKPGYIDEKQFHCVYMRNNSKTLFFTLTDKLGNVLHSLSSGMVGLKGSKRLGTPAIDLLSRKIAFFARQLNVKIISVNIQVTNNLFNLTALKIFLDAGLEIVKLVERIPVSHNGCRLKKTRRI
ncbi:MAG: 30S ribosomal protein S11 [Burkholderiaceae bacterium]|nr:30S ribosomal protein S11 [Burkholderiaceae bacterium]